MHELSIAMGIVDIALEEAGKRRAWVTAIHLDLGRLSGVVPEALLFSYEIASKDTELEGSRLMIREIPIEVHCPHCAADRVLESMQRFCCPSCGAPTPQVLHGKELSITGLEVRDEP